MSVEEVKQLATFEYGSRLQGIADEHSDSDVCVLTLPSINDLFFAINKEKQNHKVDDTSYVPVTAFIKRIYDKCDIASIILLHGFAKQCTDTTLYCEVFGDDFLQNMLHANRTRMFKGLSQSCMGIGSRDIKKISGEFKGKTFINVLNSLERLMKLKALMRNEHIDLAYLIEVQDLFVNINQFIELGLKRENGKTLLSKLNEYKTEINMHNKNIDTNSVECLVESLKVRYEIECNEVKRTMDKYLTKNDKVETEMRDELQTRTSQYILKYGKFN